MPKSLRVLIVSLLAIAIAGCGLVYHPPREQGNLLDEETVNQLTPGMSKRQVLVLMGSPAVETPFDHDRWDYIRATTKRGGKQETGRLTLYFDGDTLAQTEGDLFAGDNTDLLEQAKIFEKAGTERDAAYGPKGDKD